MVCSLNGITRSPRGMARGSDNPAPHCALPWMDRVEWDVIGQNGEKKAHGVHEGNLVVTYGLARLAAILATDAGGGSAFANYAVIGTDSTAVGASDAALGASTQAHGTFSRAVSGVSVNYTATFASNSQASAIKEIGLYQTNTYTGSMIARSVLGTDSINRGTGDTIQVTYTLVCKTAA